MKSTRLFVFVILWLPFGTVPLPGAMADDLFLPYYRDATCGANCLYAVCLLRGVDTTLEEVYRLVGGVEKGSSMLDLLNAAKKLGLNPRPLKTTLRMLAKTDAYAIVHLDRGHFVLCAGWRGNNLVIVDPPENAYLMTKDDFQQQWTGYALLFDKSKVETSTLAADRRSDSRDDNSGREEKQSRQSLTVNGTSADTGQIPEMAHVLLGAILRGKSTRNDIRRLHMLLNKSAPEIQAESWLNCSPLAIEQLRGRIVVLDFWSIGCGACLGEIGDLNEIHGLSESTPVTVLGVHSYIDDSEEVKRIITGRNIEYAVCIDNKSTEHSDGKTFDEYSVMSVPQRFLIDIYGRIRSVDTVVGPKLEELIKEATDGVQATTVVNLDQRFGVKVAPKVVSFGKLPQEKRGRKSVYVYKPDEPNFVLNVESGPDKPATAQLFRYRQSDALLYELRVVFPVAPPAQNYKSQIRLTTNDLDTPLITIPVTAIVVPQ
jgi:predicted double-glycine peptidase/thiol-disulfide isomerase/thioredoxin